LRASELNPHARLIVAALAARRSHVNAAAASQAVVKWTANAIAGCVPHASYGKK